MTSVYARALRLRDLIERIDRLIDELWADGPLEARDRSCIELTLESAAAVLDDFRRQEFER
jgi:hypothetical protein